MKGKDHIARGKGRSVFGEVAKGFGLISEHKASHGRYDQFYFLKCSYNKAILNKKFVQIFILPVLAFICCFYECKYCLVLQLTLGKNSNVFVGMGL